jgi:hypothetical protein
MLLLVLRLWLTTLACRRTAVLQQLLLLMQLKVEQVQEQSAPAALAQWVDPKHGVCEDLLGLAIPQLDQTALVLEATSLRRQAQRTVDLLLLPVRQRATA